MSRIVGSLFRGCRRWETSAAFLFLTAATGVKYDVREVAIRQIRRIPSELLAACLFFDDVEEITSIIEQLPSYYPDANPPTISYSVGDRTCDTVDDFKKIEGTTKTFSISSRSGYLNIGGNGSSFAALHADEYAWKAYGKVQAIFEHRSSGGFNTLRNSPRVSFFLLSVLLFLPLFVWRFVTVRPVYRYESDIIYWLLLWIIAYPMTRTHSVVELRYFDETKHERFTEMRPAVWAAIINAILGGLVTVLRERVVKWQFP